ncbi:MAG: DUF7948 domain-containing protein [Candidatus Dormibacteria bacterium]
MTAGTMRPAAVAHAAVVTPPPALFEANVGQADPATRYLLRDGLATAFTTLGPVIEVPPALPAESAAARADPLARLHAIETLPAPSLVHVGWVGGDTTQLKASPPVPSHVSYLLGATSSTWHADVPECTWVAYDNLYPGIDLTYTVAAGGLESTYTVAAGADAEAIAVRYDGARSLAVEAGGSLAITLLDGRRLTQRAPVAWQTLDGVHRPVPVSFVAGGDVVRFRLGPHVSTAPLVIDPTFAFSTFLGGNGEDHPWATATDPAGDTYITGYTYSTDFPVTGGAYQATSQGSSDAFVTKLDPRGQLLWSTYLGGSNFDNSFDIHVDGSEDVYITGATLSTDFPVTSGAYQSTNVAAVNGGPSSSAFISELDASGTHLLASTYLGGTLGDQLQGPGLRFPPQSDDESIGTGITTDAAGAVYVGLETDAVDFPTSSGAPQTVVHGNYDGAITKLTRSLSALDWSTYIGGQNYDFVSAIAVDAGGDAYVTGETTSTQLFPTTAGAYQTALPGGFGAFIAELDAAGTAWTYSTYFSGTTTTCGALGLYTVPTAMLLDGRGDVLFTGETSATDTPVTSGVVAPPPSKFCTAAYVTVLNSTGSRLVQSAMFGGSDYNGGFGLGRDSGGNLWVDGYTSSSTFPVTADAMQPSYPGGNHSAFVTELSSDESSIRYSSFLGGSTDDYGYGLAVDPSNGVHVTGITQSADFPIANALQPAYAGGGYSTGGFDDGFVALIIASPASNVPEAPAPGLLLLAAGAALGVIRRRRGGAVAVDQRPENRWMVATSSSR